MRLPWRPRRKDAVRASCHRRSHEQVVAGGAIEDPEYEQVREAFKIGQPVLELRQDIQDPLMCCACS
jgi:hypothetical protein